MNESILYDLLNRALSEELGVVVETNNPNQLSLRLHSAAKGLPRYEPLIITVPSSPNTVMIVKRSVELDDLGEPNE